MKRNLFVLLLSLLLPVQANSQSCVASPTSGTRVLLVGETQKLLTYKIKHSFSLYPSVNFSPKIFAVSFNHAWVKDPVAGCAHARVKPFQPASFNKFGKDTIISQVPYNNEIAVDTVIHWIGNSGGSRLDSVFADSCYSRAKAVTCIVVDSVKSASVTGTIQSWGFAQAVNPPINTDAYAFSWCGVSVQDGQPLKKGDIGWVPGTTTQSKGKSRNIRQKAGTNDPINFEVHDYVTGLDTSGTLLSIVMRQELDDDTLEKINYWENDTVHIESDSLLFRIHFPTPFTASQGTLTLLIQNGFVVQSFATGVFSSVPMPLPSTPVPVTFPLPNEINFHYNLDTSGLFNNDSILVRLFMFGNNENHHVLTYDTVSLFPTPHRPSCPGSTDGSMDLFVNYGSPPYLFMWSNGSTVQTLTNVPAGIYSVIVIDSLGVTATVSDTIFDPPPLVLSGAVTPVTCKGAHDGTITLSVAGGTPGYSYLWNSGSHAAVRTGLYPKTYTVTVTDSKGCTVMMSFTVVQSPSSLTVGTSKTNVNCAGKCTGRAKAIPAGGTSPYAYLWNTGATTSLVDHLCAGTYTCTVTDAYGCSKSKTFVITQPPALLLSASPTGNPGEAAAMATGGTPPYSFKWFTVPEQTTATATGLTGGNVYKVKVTDIHACTKTIFFTMPVTRMEIQQREPESLFIFPNPARDHLTVELNTGLQQVYRLEILDVLGQVVLAQTIPNGKTELDIRPFPEGIYMVKIAGQGTVVIRKVILLGPKE